MKPDDIEELMKETELDSAKMIFRLTAELKEKELELAALRSDSFAEIQRNNKAKEAEFEALIRGQEASLRKREEELSRLLVNKEAGLWKEHQAALEEAIASHRKELEEERAGLHDEIARKEAGILEQKRNLRLEMEAVFKKWESEREEDFRNERKTFIEELKLGRETARREAEERAGQMEELWKEKLAQSVAELEARHKLELEEVKGRESQARMKELREINDRLSAEFSLKETQACENYSRWLSDNKKLIENDFSGRLARTESDYSARISSLEEAIKRSEEELSRRQALWESRHAELKKIYSDKEAGLERQKREAEDSALRAEQELAARYDRLEKELTVKAEKLRESLEEREAEVAREREELARFRSQVSETIRQRETELAGVFEDRHTLLKSSLEESFRIKELGLSRKYEEVCKQLSTVSAQKDAAQARVGELASECGDLKRLLDGKESALRRAEEQELARTAQLRRTFEEEFSLKAQELRTRISAGEQALRKDFEERLRTETASLAEQYRIKEEGLAAQRDLINSQAADLEAKFIEALKVKEKENAENIKKALAGLNAQLEAARTSAAEEQEAWRGRLDESRAAQRLEFETALKEADFQRELQVRAAGQRAETELRQRLELAEKKTEEAFQQKLSDLESRCGMLEQNLKFAAESRDAAKVRSLKLKEEIELLTIKLEEAGGEKQGLIQANLSQARDLRQTLEKEYMDKLAEVEKNYLGQLSDAIRRGEAREKELRDDYFRKMEFIKEEYSASAARQAKETEDACLERENRLRSALEETYKLKEKTLQTRLERTERNYESALAEKTAQLDNDRLMAESVAGLKTELEAKNRELNSKLAEQERILDEAKKALEAAGERGRKELENDYRVRTEQLELDRSKLKALLEQEHRLVADLQKREAALQESYAEKEAAMAREFARAREKLEREYRGGPGAGGGSPAK